MLGALSNFGLFPLTVNLSFPENMRADRKRARKVKLGALEMKDYSDIKFSHVLRQPNNQIIA